MLMRNVIIVEHVQVLGYENVAGFRLHLLLDKDLKNVVVSTSTFFP